MQKSKERIVSFFDVVLRAHTYGEKLDLTPLPLLTFVKKIQAWHVSGQCPKKGKKSAETLYLADIKISQNNKRVDFLINRSDRDASDTVYSNPENNVVRSLPKATGEGNDFSAHLVINLVPVGSRYSSILELTPGLASGKVAAFLNFLFRNCISSDRAAFEVPHPNGATDRAGVSVKILAYHKAELQGQPSDDFKNSLNGGVLESVELIDRRKNSLSWDSNGLMTEVSRSVTLRAGTKKTSPNFSRLKAATALAVQKKYDSARVIFKSPQGVLTRVTLDGTDMLLAKDTLYVKKVKISGFTQLLEASYQTLHPEITLKMAQLL